jgi:hypothetical protein
LGSIGILIGIFAVWFVRRRPSVHIPSQEVAPVYSNR